ncbi:MAG: mannose-1-phosphate guanylyltransferase [Candidatus Nanopelagicales bacterium]
MLEAILLVGGQGTRLRPLTIETPKPMLPVAGKPCTEHQIARLREAGVTRVILGTSYRAEVFEEYFGDGSRFGVELVCVTERVPLGTGGAIRNVLDALQSGPHDPVLILNGDVLSGHDMAGQVAHHRQQQADVTLHLINVDDPRPFGLVPTDAENRVTAFLEKPQTPEEIVTHQINAGCYVFSRHVIDAIPTGRPVSVERETFPALLARQAPVLGWVEDAYWLDLGNPLAFARGSRDLVTGIAPSPAVTAVGQSLILGSASVDPSARVDGGSCLGDGAFVDEDALVRGSVVMEGAHIAEGAIVIDSIIGRDAFIGPGTSCVEGVVANRAHIGANNEFAPGVRIFPDAVIGDTAVRFSTDRT